MNQDIILDTLDTLLALLQSNGGALLPAHRGEAERIVRAAWAGERPYIGKRGEIGQVQISERDRSIRRDHAHGAHVPFIARRYGLSERRVQEIVQGEERRSAADCLTGRANPADAVPNDRSRTPKRQAAS